MRKAQLAKIHIGRKQMGWDDVTYRSILLGRYGVESAARLSDKQLDDMCNYLKEQGVQFKPSDPKKEKKRWYKIPDNVPYCRQKRYIAALCRELGWTMSGLDTRCKRQFGVDKFIWLNKQSDLQTLAKDLQNRCNKRGIDPAPW